MTIKSEQSNLQQEVFRFLSRFSCRLSGSKGMKIFCLNFIKMHLCYNIMFLPVFGLTNIFIHFSPYDLTNRCAIIAARHNLPISVNHATQLHCSANNRYAVNALLHTIGVQHQQGQGSCQPRCKATSFHRSASHEGVASKALPPNAFPSDPASRRTVRAVPLHCRS